MKRLLSALLTLLAALVLLGGCGRFEPPEKRGELVVGILANPVFYQPGESGEAEGMEYDLALAFAQHLGVKLRFVVAPDMKQLRYALGRGNIHLAAAVPTTMEKAGLRFTTPLRESRQVVVQHADRLLRDEAADIAGHRIEVLRGSPQVKALELLELDPPPKVVEMSGIHGVDLLARVAERQSDLAAVNAVDFDVATNYYPDLAVVAELPGKVAHAWAFRAQDEALRQKAEAFIAGIQADGTLARLNDRYLGHIKRVHPSEIAHFIDQMQTRLPHYRQRFHQAQILSGIDWRLLTALAWQESRWDPLATSPTGVRGMMMLTEDTADRMRVTNRLDVWQSIRAGSEYLADLRDQFPPEVKEPDRTWLALAAYNLGMGHMNGGRAIAKGLNRNPDSWYDMKRVLPLLARPQYYSRLKSGRARGGEAVILVENVRIYYDILCRFERPYAPVVTPGSKTQARPSKAAKRKAQSRSRPRSGSSPK